MLWKHVALFISTGGKPFEDCDTALLVERDLVLVAELHEFIQVYRFILGSSLVEGVEPAANSNVLFGEQVEYRLKASIQLYVCRRVPEEVFSRTYTGFLKMSHLEIGKPIWGTLAGLLCYSGLVHGWQLLLA